MNKSYSVITVDDSSFTRNLIKQLLSNTEFRVIGEATNGQDAVEVARQHHPDIILLDIVMPEKNGYFALIEMMRIGIESSVIMLSSVGTEQMVEKCLMQGAETFIQKPFDKDLLLNHLRNIVTSESEVSHG